MGGISLGFRGPTGAAPQIAGTPGAPRYDPATQRLSLRGRTPGPRPTAGMGGVPIGSRPGGGGLTGMPGGAGPSIGGMPGGGGAATTGMGSGFGGPGTVSTTAQAEVSPYLQQIMDMYKGLYAQAGALYDKPLDWAKERADMRASQSQKLNEMRQMGGLRGQAWGAQLGQAADEFGREIAGAEAGFGNRQLDAQRQILGEMGNVLGGLSGVGNTAVQSQLGQMQAQQGMNQLALESWKAQMQLPLEYYKAQQAGQANTLGLLRGLL